jgi:hypothetical protein
MGVQPAKGGLLKVAKFWTAGIAAVCVLVGFTMPDGPTQPPGPQRSIWSMPLTPGQWTSIGPNPMGVLGETNTTQAGNVVALDYGSHSHVLYAATQAGGVWAKRGNKPWEPLTDSLPNLNMLTVAVDPNNNDIIWAGASPSASSDRTVFRSEDGGLSWKAVAGGPAVNKILVDPTDSKRVYATGDFGVGVSTDGGRHWTGRGFGSATDLAIADNGVVYAVLADGSLQRSVDHGDSWVLLFTGHPLEQDGTPYAARLVIAPTTRNLPQDQQVVWVAAGSHHLDYLYRYIDGNVNTFPLDPHGEGNCWHNLLLTGDPHNADAVYLGINHLYRVSLRPTPASQVSGAAKPTLTLRQVGGDTYHEDLHALLLTPEGLILGDDGGVHRSSNGGKTFAAYNDGLADTEFYSGAVNPSGTVILAGSQDNGLDRAVVGKQGVAWESVFKGDGIDVVFNQVDQNLIIAALIGAPLLSSPDSGYCVGSGVCLRSKHGIGSIGSASITPDEPVPFRKSLYASPTGSTYYANQYLWRTDDGLTWRKLGRPAAFGDNPFRWLAISRSRPDLMYATDGKVVVRSSDGGKEWDFTWAVGGERRILQLAVDPEHPNIIYALGNLGLSVTIDGGKTWVENALPGNDIQTMTVGAKDMLVATGDGVFRSLDRGVSWKEVGQGLPHVHVSTLVESPDGKEIIAFTFGRGAYIEAG